MVDLDVGLNEELGGNPDTTVRFDGEERAKQRRSRLVSQRIPVDQAFQIQGIRQGRLSLIQSSQDGDVQKTDKEGDAEFELEPRRRIRDLESGR